MLLEKCLDIIYWKNVIREIHVNIRLDQDSKRNIQKCHA